MPKRIPRLAETIVEKASLLFSRHGYDAVDMKMVAAEAGTSVGNLYNYYPSKPALFLAIKEAWRNDVVEACRTILASEAPRRDRILGVLHRLYDDIAQWQGLWSEFLSGREEQAQVWADRVRNKGVFGGFGPEESLLLGEFEALLTRSPPPPGAYRWASLLITATVQVAKRYPSDREENWKFLENLVDKI